MSFASTGGRSEISVVSGLLNFAQSIKYLIRCRDNSFVMTECYIYF